jgi:CBS domain-containing protein
MDRLAEILQKRSPVVHPLPPEATVLAAVAVMADRGVGAVPIVEHGQLIGVFSERDVLRRVLALGRAPERTPLKDVMTRDPVTASVGESRLAAIVKMQAAGCRHLPIVVDGMVIDMLSIRDLLFHEIAARDAEIDALKKYIHGNY